MKFIQVTSAEQIGVVSELAYRIWHDHYTPIIGDEQVGYMLEKFQSPRAIYDQIEDGDFVYFLVNRDEKYIGYLGLEVKQDSVLISKLYILNTERSKGVGREILSFIESYSVQNAIYKIMLTVNRNNLRAIKFYLNGGFHKEKEIVFDIGKGFVMDDFILVKTLIVRR